MAEGWQTKCVLWSPLWNGRRIISIQHGGDAADCVVACGRLPDVDHGSRQVGRDDVQRQGRERRQVIARGKISSLSHPHRIPQVAHAGIGLK
jgi:hypothetical protein